MPRLVRGIFLARRHEIPQARLRAANRATKPGDDVARRGRQDRPAPRHFQVNSWGLRFSALTLVLVSRTSLVCVKNEKLCSTV
jgi:hypothetical protein